MVQVFFAAFLPLINTALLIAILVVLLGIQKKL